MDSPLEFATNLAVETGKHLLGFFAATGTVARLKEDYSVVTEADLSADELITRSIHHSFPGEALISEELQPTLGDSGGPIWVVDPLDGTTNFSLGMPIWGVSIARLIDGKPSTGAIYFPVLEELFTAQIGSGAYLNGAKISTRPPVPDQPNSFFSCCTRTHQKYDISIRYKTRILGSACYSFCAVARGMAIIGFEATPKIWDLAASWLIVEEAGGAIESIDERQPFPLGANLDFRKFSFPTLAGADSEMVSKSRGKIQPRQVTL